MDEKNLEEGSSNEKMYSDEIKDDKKHVIIEKQKCDHSIKETRNDHLNDTSFEKECKII